ncbi:MAG: glycosyltransferase family 39 protein [Candidatus Aenigmatarchaeota archaeon]
MVKKRIVTILSFIIFFLTYYFSINSKTYWWDEAVYLGLAKNLVTKFSYFINYQFPEKLTNYYGYKLVIDESFRQPLFPFLLSIFYFLGEKFQRILPPIFASLSIFLTFKLGKKIKDENLGLISAIFLSVSPLFLFFSSKILTESLSSFLIVSFFYFLISYKNDFKSFFFSSLFLSLSILTRYTNFILSLPFLLVFLKYKNIKHLFLAIIIAFLVFLPFLLFSYYRYGNPFEAIIISFKEVSTKKYYQEPFYFYFINLVPIFGLPILFSFFTKLKKENKILIFTVILIFLSFSILSRKEFRYLVPYFPLFYIASSLGLVNLEKSKKIWIIVLIIILLQIYPCYNLLTIKEDNSIVLISNFLKDKVSEDDFVIAENYPVLNYLTGAKVLPYPGSIENFYKLLEIFKPKFAVIDKEITLPEYAKELEKYGFEKIYEINEIKVLKIENFNNN